jgi:hypothetical protein
MRGDLSDPPEPSGRRDPDGHRPLLPDLVGGTGVEIAFSGIRALRRRFVRVSVR